MIDEYCPGRCDAPAAFCRLLDARRGAAFTTVPPAVTVRRRYRGPTNVLETAFTTAGGAVRLTDLMPVRGRSAGEGDDVSATSCILRLVGARDDAEIDVSFRPTFAGGARPGAARRPGAETLSSFSFAPAAPPRPASLSTPDVQLPMKEYTPPGAAILR